MLKPSYINAVRDRIDLKLRTEVKIVEMNAQFRNKLARICINIKILEGPCLKVATFLRLLRQYLTTA